MQVATAVKPNERRKYEYLRAEVLRGGRVRMVWANAGMEW